MPQWPVSCTSLPRIDGHGSQPARLAVAVATWTLRGDVGVEEKFLRVMQNIVDDDRQAEAYYQLFKLPSNASATFDLDKSYTAHSTDVHYLSVAIGTCEQFVELHGMYDIRSDINGVTQTQGAAYVHLAPHMRCV